MNSWPCFTACQQATPINWDWDQGNVMDASSEPNKYHICVFVTVINSITLKYLALYKSGNSKKRGGFYFRPSLNLVISCECTRMLVSTHRDFKSS